MKTTILFSPFEMVFKSFFLVLVWLTGVLAINSQEVTLRKGVPGKSASIDFQLKTQNPQKSDPELFKEIMGEYSKIWEIKQKGLAKINRNKLFLEIELQANRKAYLVWADKICMFMDKIANKKVTRTYSKSGISNKGLPERGGIYDDGVVIITQCSSFVIKPEFLNWNSGQGKIFAVVNDYDENGNCTVQNYYFQDKNPFYQILNENRGEANRSSFWQSQLFCPNILEISVRGNGNQDLALRTIKGNAGRLWGGGGFFGVSNNYENNNIETFTPFPFIRINSFGTLGNSPVWSIKCPVSIAFPVKIANAGEISSINFELISKNGE
jgi:hypothetical protein